MRQQSLWLFPEHSGSQREEASGYAQLLDKDTLLEDAEPCKGRSPPSLSSYSSADICILLAATTTHPAPGTELLTCRNTVPLQIVQLLRAITWRFRALRRQIAPTGPINFRPLSQEAYEPGACGLCGSLLVRERGEQFRCMLCRIAVLLVLNHYPPAFWLGGTTLDEHDTSCANHMPEGEEVQGDDGLESPDESEVASET
jgi:hypothetical protein